MIYLNHAGTSWPKPREVQDAATEALNVQLDNWGENFAQHHQTVATWFGASAERLLLTPGCTSALSLALSDFAWSEGDRVLTSAWEHHAVMRGLHKLSDRGVTFEIIPPSRSQAFDLEAFEASLKSGPIKMVAVTGAANVTGDLLPIEAITETAHRYGATVLIDGAQIAGWLDLDLTRLKFDLFTFAGHKGLQAVWGIGGLYVAPNVIMECPTASCELPAIQDADENEQGLSKSVMPGYCDAGSVDQIALASLAAGCDWLGTPEQVQRLEIARNCIGELEERLSGMSRVKLFRMQPISNRMPTVAFAIDGHPSSEIASYLREEGFIVGAGFQCSPETHNRLGTNLDGVLRVSIGPASAPIDWERFASALKKC